MEDGSKGQEMAESRKTVGRELPGVFSPSNARRIGHAFSRRADGPCSEKYRLTSLLSSWTEKDARLLTAVLPPNKIDTDLHFKVSLLSVRLQGKIDVAY